jgi:hypothetical protein
LYSSIRPANKGSNKFQNMANVILHFRLE